MAMDRQTAAGVAAGMGAVFLWSGWAVTTRLGALGSLDALDLAALRYSVAGLIMLPVLARVRIGADGIGDVPWRIVAWLYLGAGLPYSLITYAGFAYSPISHQAVILPSGSMLAATLLAVLLLGERLGRWQVAGTTMIVLGVVAIGWEGLAISGPEVWLGDLCYSAGAILWAVFTIAARAARVRPMLAAAIVSVLSLATFAPIYLWTAGLRLLSLPWTEVMLQALYQGLLAGVLGLILFSRAVMLLGAARASLFGAFGPVVSTSLAIPVLGEWPSSRSLVGLVLASAGMVLAITARAPAAKAPPETTSRS